MLNIDLTRCAQGVIAPRVGTAGQAGLGSLGYQPISGAANSNLPQTFPGQVFFSNAPGQIGNMELNFLRGPLYFNWDSSIIKNIRIKEDVRIQLRAEAFNTTNRANFTIGQQQNIGSTSFGRMTTQYGGANANRIIQFVGRVEF